MQDLTPTRMPDVSLTPDAQRRALARALALGLGLGAGAAWAQAGGAGALLVDAAQRGDRARVRALLEAVILGDGGPAHAEIVRLLIAAGAALNLADRNGVTPLQHALQRGQTKVAALLRAAGAR
jgi:hypothetical protein